MGHKLECCNTQVKAEFILDFHCFVARPFFEVTVHSLQFSAHDLKQRTRDNAIKKTLSIEYEFSLIHHENPIRHGHSLLKLHLRSVALFYLTQSCS